MLPPSSTVMSSGPRRAAKVAPLAVGPPPLRSHIRPRATASKAAAPMRQRGRDFREARRLLGFCIGKLFPLTVVFDVKNPQIVPELQAGYGVADQRLRALVSRIGQIVLGVHLVLRPRPPQLSQQVLLFNPPLGQFYADLADFIIALGLVQSAPAIADL